jgi:hypothetical protein
MLFSEEKLSEVFKKNSLPIRVLAGCLKIKILNLKLSLTITLIKIMIGLLRWPYYYRFH